MIFVGLYESETSTLTDSDVDIGGGDGGGTCVKSDTSTSLFIHIYQHSNIQPPDLDHDSSRIPVAKPPKRYARTFGFYALRGMAVCGVRSFEVMNENGVAMLVCDPLSVFWPPPKKIGREVRRTLEFWKPS